MGGTGRVGEGRHSGVLGLQEEWKINSVRNKVRAGARLEGQAFLMRKFGGGD